MSSSALSRLAQRAPQVQIRTDAGDLEHYGRDWTRRWTPAPLAIAFPSSIEDVQEIVRWAVESGVALVPSGGRTGLSGGAVAANGELVVSFERMNRILDFDPVDRYLTVQPGVALQTVQRSRAATRACCTRSTWARAAPARSAATSRPMPAASGSSATAIPASGSPG